MAIETEKKYRLDKKLLVEFGARLRELGAEFAYEAFEENYLHRGGALDDRNAVLRIRKTNERTVLTYKEKIASPSEFKHQIEHETVVSDVEATEAIIQKLGYRLAAVYEKHRIAYRFGNVEIVLDELPFGYYMEIEGTTEDILTVEKQIGADRLEPEARGYPRLTVKYGKQVNGVIEARFQKATIA
jgi:predicted adenylyl cyclase CyaB